MVGRSRLKKEIKMKPVLAAGCAAVIVYLLFTSLAFALVGWVIVAAVNMFVAEPFSFGFGAYMVLGLAISIVTQKRRG